MSFLLALPAIFAGTATAGTTMGALGGMVGLLGTGVQAIGAYEQGQTQAGIYNYDAQVARQQAQAAQVEGSEKSRQLSDQKRKMAGAQVAAFGGAGVTPGVGTPLDVMADTYKNYERDIQTTGYNTEVAMEQATSQSDIYRWAAGRASTAGLLGAGTTILGGVGRSLIQPGF